MSSNCVADFSAARTNLRPLYNLWFVLSLTSLSLHRHGHHSAQETRNQQLAGQLSVSRPAALELPSRVSKSHPVSREFRSVCLPSSAHTLALSHVPDLSQIFLSGLTSSMKSYFPLFRSNARCCSFIVFKLHWTSLSSGPGLPVEVVLVRLAPL